MDKKNHFKMKLEKFFAILALLLVWQWLGACSSISNEQDPGDMSSSESDIEEAIDGDTDETTPAGGDPEFPEIEGGDADTIDWEPEIAETLEDPAPADYENIEMEGGELPVDIPDPGTLLSKIIVADDYPVYDISVEIDLIHTFVPDLRLTLISPSGRQLLIRKPGAPYAEEHLSIYETSDAFRGARTGGDWILKIDDTQAGDAGLLFRWKIRFHNPPELEEDDQGFPKQIPDYDPSGASDTKIIKTADLASGVCVSVSLQHRHAADLQIELVAPSGTIARLKEKGIGDFSYSGDVEFQTDEMSEETAGGPWALVIRDLYEGDVGTWYGWDLTVQCFDPNTSPDGDEEVDPDIMEDEIEWDFSDDDLAEFDMENGDSDLDFESDPELEPEPDPEPVDTYYVAEEGLPLPIPDNDPAGVENTMNVDEIIWISGLCVDVQISHPDASELVVTLTGPMGETILLHEHEAGIGGIYKRFRPTDFSGAWSWGDWQIHVADTSLFNEGKLEGWALDFGCGPPSGVDNDFDPDIDVDFDTSCPPDVYRNINQSHEFAIPLAIPIYIENLVVCDDVDDWFRFPVPAGKTVTVRITFNHSNGDIDMRLHRDGNFTGSVDSSTSVGNSEEVSYRAQETGFFYVRIYLFSRASNTYDMRVSLSE